MKTARKSRPDSYISIRSKLVAAVAMLLVASFMVVSSSYAWFTLSTAPEVKGIQTTVGANGNLEIALFTGKDVAQSGLNDTGKNETWGNLINLSDPKYGLGKIKLYPARLNATGNAITVGSPLMTPVYAADGRIKELAENTLFGSYNTKGTNFMEFDAANSTEILDTDNETVLQTKYGVRGVGNSNGLTPQQLDYRNAVVAITTAKSAVKSNAELSLSGGAGSKLASIAADKATANADDFDLTAIEDMLVKLEAAIDQVDLMALNYIRTIIASENATAEDVNYAQTKADYYDNEKIETDLATWVAKYTADPYAANTELKDLWAFRTTAATALATSRGKYDTLKNSEALPAGPAIKHATWAQTTDILDGLVDMNAVTINDIAMSELKAKDEQGNYIHMNTLISAVTSSGLYVTIMPPASGPNGVYIDLANISGDLSANIHLEKITAAAGITVGPLEAKMKTAVAGAPTVDLTTQLPTEPTNEGVEGAATINDLYGYIIDLAFRTNAADSDLMLQTTPKNRIYSTDLTNEDTMGVGSTMAFVPTATFTAAQVTKLMQHIRIVFADINGTIYAVGGLDISDTKTVNMANLQGAIAAPIRLYEANSYTLTKEEGFKPAATGLKPIDGENAKILDMPLNEQVELSVYVYLDGDSVQNGDVATEGQLEGMLNLQFSSSAALVPMEYNPLRTPEGTNP